MTEPLTSAETVTVERRLMQMRADLVSLVKACNDGYEFETALEGQQLVVLLDKFAESHSDNFERSLWPPRVDEEGDGLQWSDT